MTVVRVVEMPTCKVTDKPIANIRATAVREVRVGLRLAFEVDSRAVGPERPQQESHGTDQPWYVQRGRDEQS